VLQQQTWSVLTQIWLTLLHQRPLSRCVRRDSRRSVSVMHHSWHQAQLCMLPTSTYTEPSTAAQSYVRPRPAPSPSHSLVACEWLAHPCNELTAMICMVDHTSSTVCHEVPSFHNTDSWEAWRREQFTQACYATSPSPEIKLRTRCLPSVALPHRYVNQQYYKSIKPKNHRMSYL